MTVNFTVQCYTILIIFLMTDILKALDLETMEAFANIVRQLEVEPFDEEEKNNEGIQSLLEGINFEEEMEYEIENPIHGRDVPMKLCDSSNNLHDHPPQQQEQQQQQQQQQSCYLLHLVKRKCNIHLQMNF